ncbi:MAG: HAMP domain-containing histidine kinase [Comamonadaceae bacterium]|nr:MAG: HAMP domain-containing histidine kinase [Comamonadaceae bacterium]
MKREAPRLGLASFRRRILLRGVFLLLALATIALPVALLRDEKQRIYASYEQGFRKTQAELMARLREPAGLLALLNPRAGGEVTPLKPMLLPYPALDFEDATKVQQAVELAGCPVRYPDGATLCAAVGSNAFAGGYLYLVGSFRTGDLVPREPGVLDLEGVHRARIRLEMRGELKTWIAPFERLSLRGEPLVRGRLNGFVHAGEAVLDPQAKPVRDFRGWAWQGATCDAGGELPDCPRRVFYSIRLPVEAFRESLFARPRSEWPPADLDRIRVHVQMLAPGAAEPLFDSSAAGAVAPTSLDDIGRILQPGQVLSITPENVARAVPVVLRGDARAGERSSPLILRLVDLLPVATQPARVHARETIGTPLGNFDVRLTGEPRGIDRGLSVVATRLSWYVAAMLGAIVLAWAVIEVGLIRRIAVLTRRAAAVSHDMHAEGIAQLDVSDLRGRDELGILAGGLADLLQRVKADVQREQLRAQRERDMLQAVGHEILSPLQSLMVLHPKPEDPAHRYVQRMQQAVKVLYGQASPSEALAAAELQLAPLDLDAFLREVAGNAGFAGIADVRYAARGRPLVVRADGFSLEDVVTHILRNADRHRTPGTPITLALEQRGGQAVIGIHNAGSGIPEALRESIFDYGVSDAAAEPGARRGQGLFVARTYMAKMGGTVEAVNTADGVRFDLSFPLAS